MDSIGSVLSTIGGGAASGAGDLWKILKTAGPGKDILGGLAGVGTISDFLQQRQQAAARSRLQALSNPATQAADIASLTQPLNAGLVSNVENQTQGYLGERGLNESPAITSEVVSQALAPYVQQNQAQAMNEFQQQLAALQASLGGSGIDTGPLWAALFGTPNKTGSAINNAPPGPSPATTTPPFSGSNPGSPGDLGVDLGTLLGILGRT